MPEFGFNTPFKEQLDFFRKKLNLPSERWDDIMKSAHDRAFIVAGAMQADLLNDLRRSIDKAIEHGGGIEEYRRDFRQIVFNRGWTGWTGEGSKAGEAWRTRQTYRTNMSTSYAAGRHQQMTDPEYLKFRPYWRYMHNDGVIHPRPMHKSWHGTTLPHDHPFWATHFAPNGHGCQCHVIPVDKWEDLKQPPDGWDKIDPKTGEQVGIDRGFGYAPGANATRPMKEFIDQKLIRLDAPVGAVMWQALQPVLKAEQLADVRNLVATAAASMEPAGAGALAHVIAPATVASLAARGVELNDAAVWLRDEQLIHAVRDAKADRGAALPLEVWLALPEYLDVAIPYWDVKNNNLLYAFDLPGITGKVAVHVNYSAKVKPAGKRKSEKIRSNFIVTGGVIEARVLGSDQYVLLGKDEP